MALLPGVIDQYLSQLPPYQPEFKGANRDWLHHMIREATGIDYQPITTPRGKHQLEAVAFSLHHQRALLYYEMRLGKTKIALDWAEHLRLAGMWKAPSKGLVILHAPIALDVWETETPIHSDLKVALVRTKPSELFEALTGDADLVAIPWSGLQTIFSAKKQVTVHKLKKVRGKEQSVFEKQNKLVVDLELVNLAAEAFSLAIIDEIHYAKTKQTTRFTIARGLLQWCDFRLGLTGTPFGRNPYDIWAEAFLIDDGKALGHNFNFFRQAFAKPERKKATGFRQQPVFDEDKELVLVNKLTPLVLSCETKEVHDVNVFTGTIHLHMEQQQRDAYEDMLDRFVQIPGSDQTAVITSFIRLRQISSGYLPFSDEQGNPRIMRFPYNPKLTWLKDFIEQGISIQYIIFHEFIESGRMICDLLQESGVTHGWLYGGTKDTKAVVQDFQAGRTQVLVANNTKGGMAIDLPMADYILFYECPTSPIIRQQAAARPMSRGEKPLSIDDMVTSGVEARVLSFIAQGKDLLRDIVHSRHLLKA